MIKRKINITKVGSKFSVRVIKTYVLSGICGLMAVTAIFITIESSTNGAEFASLQSKEKMLLTTQQDLQQKLVETLSVNTLQEQSSELGFTKVTNLVYVTNTATVANSGLIENLEPVAKLPQ